jgi:uncharacterized membrane protein
MLGRKFEVDVIRGASIVLMIIFHFAYDLSLFGYASYNTNADIEWRVFRGIIVSGFLITMGMSSYLAYAKGIRWNKLGMGLAKLSATALLISLGSIYMYPQQWVYFGIIHFIALALPISLLFLRVPNGAFVLGGAIIAAYFTGYLSMQPVWQWSVTSLNIPKQTVDLVSFIPWIGVVLIGIFIAHHKLFQLHIKPKRLSESLSFLGKHSLIVYLLHQPLLFLGFNLYQQLTLN